ncbi:MAG: HEPN domain-containing protein [Tannerellaceae bacterium]|jgi:HEPN domain-containing protein|nr:HEPN domain-containing protein [Tannerellaceae bacterium]
MMTKEQYISYWINTAAQDWDAVETLFAAGLYTHCLFWAHLALEKLAKAHWVKNHEDNIPPKVHNIVWLLEESEVDLGKEMMAFLANLNEFQLTSRYPDYLGKMYHICTRDFTVSIVENAKEIRTCLLKMLQ